MRRNLVLGAAGFGAFLFAITAMSVVQTIVPSLIRSGAARPDPPGVLEPSLEERLKAAAASTKTSDTPAAAPAQTEPATPEATAAATPAPDATPAPAPAPTPSPAPVARRGPGNFDAPPAPASSGPGNFDAPSFSGGPSGPGNF